MASEGYSLVTILWLCCVASHCGDFSCCRAQALGCMGFSSCSSRALDTGSVVVVYGLSFPVACGILPDQGLNVPTLAGRFLTTGPPGKSSNCFQSNLSQSNLFYFLPPYPRCISVCTSYYCANSQFSPLSI